MATAIDPDARANDGSGGDAVAADGGAADGAAAAGAADGEDGRPGAGGGFVGGTPTSTPLHLPTSQAGGVLA
ncbi:MAG: hypothetical protein ACRDSH_10220 [Pseudonocardiaceae bacterium]